MESTDDEKGGDDRSAAKRDRALANISHLAIRFCAFQCVAPIKRDEMYDGIPLETEPRSIENVGNRIHTHSKKGIEANRLQHGFTSDVVAVWKPANGGMVTINGEVLLPVFMSDVAHGILLLDQLEEKSKPACQPLN
ncbi:uncharacterized protein TrAtP1_001932 [Trichoderma atroviride]|uniref:uncharacterized protein n=1 Tax=Hypocrea atroviridis TaxID=63577 RepID=UPI00332FA62B|nr:hypothetical protein TrAtP1_001932 [Trichoderma atroviride]